MASSTHGYCEKCGCGQWFTDDEYYPRYCEKCKKAGKITYDEILDVHELLKRVERIAVPSGDY